MIEEESFCRDFWGFGLWLGVIIGLGFLVELVNLEVTVFFFFLLVWGDVGVIGFF